VGEITHLKLFVEGDRRRAALFSGTDEAQHWVRNVEAESVLSSARVSSSIPGPGGCG
jgi:hypothetical protein